MGGKKAARDTLASTTPCFEALLGLDKVARHTLQGGHNFSGIHAGQRQPRQRVGRCGAAASCVLCKVLVGLGGSRKKA